MKKIFVFFIVLLASSTLAQLPPPTLRLPFNNSNLISAPTFQWDTAAGASGYQVGISTSSNMNNPYPTSGILIQTSWTIPTSDWESLAVGTQYYWSVRSYSIIYGLGPWQTPWRIKRVLNVINMSISIPQSINFGLVNIRQTSVINFIITNLSSSTGNLIYTIENTLLPPFSIISGTYTLLPGQSRTHFVSFTPSSQGNFNDFLIITHNATNIQSPYIINLQGTGFIQTNINKNSGDIPEKFEIFQNYPNPFNPVTTI